VALFCLALIPRLSAFVQAFITPDELSWVFRAIDFMQALEMQRWGDTFQMGHPGVITMWIGAFGVWWQRWRDVTVSAAHLHWIDNVAWATPNNEPLFRHLFPFLPPARLAMTTLNALGVVGIYVLCRRLWDRRVALIGAVLLALDPFVIGLSGLLHVDAPAMTFMALSLMAWLNGLHVLAAWIPSPRKSWCLPAGGFALLSGVCAGLSILSKSPAIFMIASVGLSALFYVFVLPSPVWQRLGKIALLGLPWAIGAMAALVGAFPAMWVDPLGVIQRIYGLADRHLDTAHRVTFFRGIGGGDPGIWFYPTVLFFRLTPVTLSGVVFSLFPLLTGRRSRPTDGQRAILASLWTFVIGFTAFITIGAKKFDRYLLPVFPALDLLAGVGWMGVIRWLYALLRRPLRRKMYTTILIVFLLAQAVMIVFGWPYYLDVYNPLAGGIKAALRTLPVGWGEGLEQVADYLNRQPNVVDQVVAGGSPVTLGPLFEGQVLSLDASSRTLADYVLIAAVDRQIYPERVADLISGARLVHTVYAGGSEVLWLYRTQSDAQVTHLSRYKAPGDIVLCDAPSPFARHAPEGDVQLVTDADEAQVVALLNRWRADHTRLWYLAYPAASPITAGILRRQLDTYAVQLEQVDLGYVTATLYILPTNPQFTISESAFRPAHFGSQLALVGGVLLKDRVTLDSGLQFRVRWQATGTPQTDYAPFIHLLDEMGHLRTSGRGDELLVDGRFWPTSLWTSGDGVELDYGLGFPSGLPPGRYWITVGLADTSTDGWVPVVDAQGEIKGTTARVLPVDIQPADRLPDPNSLKLPRAANATWGQQIKLLGYDYPSQSRVGRTIFVELGWLGQEAIEGDYALRLSLAATDGETVHEQTFPLSRYSTSRWRAGELIHEIYDLTLPSELEDSSYTVEVQVLDAQGNPLDKPFSLGNLTVSAQDRSFELAQPPQHPLNLRLGKSIALLGYDLAERTIKAGERLELNLYWRCEAPMDTSYTVFVHLLDANGQVQGQQDLVPLAGRAPTSGWVRGQIIADEYTVPINSSARPGTYRIEVGMYNPHDMVRLPVLDAEGNNLPDARVLLASEIVVPVEE
jgi:4-amino-4-deoxy-L-arabinose transferase-like glycosyltransferase